MKFNSTLVMALIGLVVMACAPLVIRNNYYLLVLTLVAINTILAVGLNLLTGYAGQVSLGHAAFYGIGAYSTAILTTRLHLSSWLAIPTGMLLAALVALLVGLPCLRLRGHYLAMATLGFGWIVNIVLTQWEKVTAGTLGIDGIPSLSIPYLVLNNIHGHHSLAIRHLALSSDVAHFYMAWVPAIVVLAITANIVNSRAGRSLRAIHSSERAAAMSGVNVARTKVIVFIISAAFAALAGSLYAHTLNFVNPRPFGFLFSVELVVMVVIGGMASVWGALLGAGTMTLLSAVLQNFGPVLAESDVIIHGLVLILAMIFMPAGLTCTIRDLLLRCLRRTSPPLSQPKKEEPALR